MLNRFDVAHVCARQTHKQIARTIEAKWCHATHEQKIHFLEPGLT